MVRQLVERIRNKDQKAMAQLYQMYIEELSSVCYRYVPAESDAKDVLQDSFIKILTSIHDFEFHGEGSLTSWIGRTVANKAFDFVRRSEIISFTSTIPDVPDEEPELERIPPEVLTRMISQMPSGYRLALNLSIFEHCSHSEIARRLGITEKTSASQLSRAKQILIKKMKDYIKRHGI